MISSANMRRLVITTALISPLRLVMRFHVAVQRFHCVRRFADTLYMNHEARYYRTRPGS